MTKGLVSIIVPTYTNEPIFMECLRSVLSFTDHPFEFFAVFNGCNYDLQIQGETSNVKIIKLSKNRGWIGGINAAKSFVNGEYVLMLNDDTQVLDYDSGWLSRLVSVLESNNKVGAVGPISNAIMGYQNITASSTIAYRKHTTPLLSGCCLLVRKDLLDQVGWLDESLPAGDDVDLSIRLRDAGYELAITRDVYISHRYAQTGKRVFGDYWDSQEYSENMRNALIKKHGLKKFLTYEQSNQVVGV